MKKLFKICLSLILILAFASILFFYVGDFGGKKNLTIKTAKGAFNYHVEKALTPQAQQKGLMYRKHLASKSGMIFIFNPPRVARMWMKNTFIPLDMVFFDRLGRVVHVHQYAIPHDETIISSEIPVAGVLEINAGDAQKYDIRKGSVLELNKQ